MQGRKWSRTTTVMKKNRGMAKELKEEAEKVALELIEHAKETARQMLLGTNLDTSKIPLICNKIIKIQSDLAWLKYLVLGLTGGVGYIVIELILRGLK